MIGRIIFISTLALVCAGPVAAESTTLSILYFQNTRGEKQHDWLRKGITDMLIGDAARSPALKVVEREDLQNVLKEQALAQSGILEDGQALELGRLLRAKLIVSGSYIVSGGVLRIEAKLTDVQSGTVRDTARAEGKLADVFVVQRRLAVDLFRALKIEAPPGLGPATDPPTESIEAVENYYQGLDLFDQGEVEAAKDKFEQASRLDPVYDKPAGALENAYKLLSDLGRLRRQRDLRKFTDRITQLRRRRSEQPFVSASDFAKETYAREDLSIEEKQRLVQERLPHLNLCASPTDCAEKQLQTMLQLGGFFQRDMEDPDTAHGIYERVVSGARAAAGRAAKDDPLRPKILVRRLEAYEKLEQYEQQEQVVALIVRDHADFQDLGYVERLQQRGLERLEDIRERFEEMAEELQEQDYRGLDLKAQLFLGFYKYRPERERAQKYRELAAQELGK